MRFIIRILIATAIAVTWFQVSNAMASGQPTPLSQGAETTAPADTPKESGYWMTNSSHKRHNQNCRYYKNSKGHVCGPNDGVACKICGG